MRDDTARGILGAQGGPPVGSRASTQRDSVMTDDEILAKADGIKAKRLAERALKVDQAEARVAAANRVEGDFLTGEGDFLTEELRYAATSRCWCGAGMAYPLDVGLRGAWECSAILTGAAKQGTSHSAAMPFAMWKVKSEAQPSARGSTTRPEAAS